MMAIVFDDRVLAKWFPLLFCLKILILCFICLDWMHQMVVRFVLLFYFFTVDWFSKTVSYI